MLQVRRRASLPFLPESIHYDQIPAAECPEKQRIKTADKEIVEEIIESHHHSVDELWADDCCCMVVEKRQPQTVALVVGAVARAAAAQGVEQCIWTLCQGEQ